MRARALLIPFLLSATFLLSGCLSTGLPPMGAPTADPSPNATTASEKPRNDPPARPVEPPKLPSVITSPEPSAPTTPSEPPISSTPPAPSTPAEPPAAENPTSAPQLIITAGSVQLTDSTGTSTAYFGDGAGLHALLTKATGIEAPRETVAAEGGNILRSEWNGAILSMSEDNRVIGFFVTAATINGAEVRTVGGITVGSSRADVLAAGGVDDGEGMFHLDAVPVSGTSSLTRPESMGVDYILVMMNGDVVERLIVPANDYGDV